MPQPWPTTALVVNALDNLSGTDALDSVSLGGRFSRPFVVVERPARGRDELPAKEEQLSSASPIPSSNSPPHSRVPTREKAVELTPEQQATVRQYMQEKLRIRKELREVQY